MDLRANGSSNYTGPSDPEALREEIARRVLAQHDGDDVNAMLGSFGVPTDVLKPQTTRGQG
jgi:hypothetical protein